MQRVERERLVFRRQLLDCGQRHERGMHFVPCGHIQREQQFYGFECVLVMCYGSVLPCGLQLVERERAVSARQLLDYGQRHERGVQCVPCGHVQREHRF